MAPLFNRRQKLNQLATEEQAGQLFWTDAFSTQVRIKLTFAFKEAFRGSWQLVEKARYLILKDEGLLFLRDKNLDAREDFLEYFQYCDDDMVPTVIEAMMLSLLDPDSYRVIGDSQAASKFKAEVNRIFTEHRISYELVGEEMVPFSSKELHQSVVQPTLQLLSNPDWSVVEDAYQEALHQISRGNAPNAITDVATALQEALIICGAEGNQLGKLIRSAKDKDLIIGHDENLLSIIDKVGDWVSADRNNLGDAHKSSSASIEDAWLIVHVAGAFLLRLSQYVKRRPI